MERERAFNLKRREGEGPGPLALARSSIAICALLTSVCIIVLQRALRKFGCSAGRVPVTARRTDGRTGLASIDRRDRGRVSV